MRSAHARRAMHEWLGYPYHTITPKRYDLIYPDGRIVEIRFQCECGKEWTE